MHKIMKISLRQYFFIQFWNIFLVKVELGELACRGVHLLFIDKPIES